MSGETPRRIRRTRDEWQRLIDEQSASGLTQTVFCQSKGLSLASFQNWKRKLAEASPTGSPWLELGTLGASSDASWDVELQLGEGICLRLRQC